MKEFRIEADSPDIIIRYIQDTIPYREWALYHLIGSRSLRCIRMHALQILVHISSSSLKRPRVFHLNAKDTNSASNFQTFIDEETILEVCEN
jgi:hypothetical protein